MFTKILIYHNKMETLYIQYKLYDQYTVINKKNTIVVKNNERNTDEYGYIPIDDILMYECWTISEEFNNMGDFNGFIIDYLKYEYVKTLINIKNILNNKNLTKDELVSDINKYIDNEIFNNIYH
jgi:hypothetical protein